MKTVLQRVGRWANNSVYPTNPKFQIYNDTYLPITVYSTHIKMQWFITQTTLWQSILHFFHCCLLCFYLPVASFGNHSCKGQDCAVDKRESELRGDTSKIFWCQKNGNYKKIQCQNSNCYCVNPRGIQIGIGVPFTRVQYLLCSGK
ncbi:uncharacterized protein LOC128249693 isoform X1 [Octopus bimaculoides]|uniref:uncharacterized protein LOC128249693 isoform X1 n=1 Tax=Octopus bimaculoides TaxID=37653 RepID=UPI0022E88F60|nr:uncharacterized protein LOC128249693 isoform X1 [Octopus bimaculoides]